MNNPSPMPQASPQVSLLPFAYQEQRSRYLKTILIAASIIGLIISFTSISIMTTAGVVALTTISLLLLILVFVPVPYALKAGLLLISVFSLGVFALVETGIFGNSRLFLLAFVLLAALLFTRREYFFALGLSVITTTAAGWLLTSGRIGLISNEVSAGSISTWLIYILVLIVIASIFESGWRRLQKEYMVTQATLKNAMTTLGNERINLESRVTERTNELASTAEVEKYRASRLLAVSNIYHSTSLMQELDQLLPAYARLIGENFGFYHVGIFLNDDKGEYTVLRAANSVGGERLLARGYRLKIGQAGIVNMVASTGQARVTPRIKDDLLYEPNPELSETRSLMALPLLAGNKVIGVLDLESSIEQGASEQDLEIMDSLADQVAIMIENTRISSENRRALTEARAVYGHYMRQAWEQFSAEKRSAGYRYAAARVNRLEDPVNLPEMQTALESGLTITENRETASMSIPLKLRDEVIGVLDVRSNNSSRQWTPNELALVQAIAERVALALENARLFEETTRRADRERAVSDITTRIRSTTDPQLMLQTALDELKRALGAKEVQVRPYSPPPADEPVK
jgi:GAF domain-containing protein